MNTNDPRMIINENYMGNYMGITWKLHVKRETR